MQSTATRALDTAPAQVHQALDRMRIVDPSLPKVGAVCGKAARTVLCGGRSVMGVPTASDGLCCGAYVAYWHKADMPVVSLNVRFRGAGSTGHCNTARSLSAGVSKPKVFRGR